LAQAMSLLNLGHYQEEQGQTGGGGRIRTAGKPTNFLPKSGRFVPPSRVSQLRDEAVGMRSRNFYHGAPALAPKSQYLKGDAILGSKEDIVVKNTSENNFVSVYQKDFSEGSTDMATCRRANSISAAFGKIPNGGFIKVKNVEAALAAEPEAVKMAREYAGRAHRGIDEVNTITGKGEQTREGIHHKRTAEEEHMANLLMKVGDASANPITGRGEQTFSGDPRSKLDQLSPEAYASYKRNEADGVRRELEQYDTGPKRQAPRNPILLGNESKPEERQKRRPVDYSGMHSLEKARERMHMRTLNFSELPGQDLAPRQLRKSNEQYGDRHKTSQITWGYHG